MNISPEEQAGVDEQAQIAWAEAMDQEQERLLSIKRQEYVDAAVADGRMLATIRIVSALIPIPGADAIEAAQVEGWKVVVKKGEFKPGDLCVFFEVDSYLDAADKRFDFLAKDLRNWQGIPGYRLKTITLRKQLSQGLALPVASFPELNDYLEAYDPNTGLTKIESMTFEGVEEFPLRDLNLTGRLKVMKWEKPLTADQLASVKGAFPSFIRKSDQERCQNMGTDIFQNGLMEHDGKLVYTNTMPGDMQQATADQLVEQGRAVKIDMDYHLVYGDAYNAVARYEVSLKLDGTSMTVYSTNFTGEVIYGVASRNLDLKTDDMQHDSMYVKDALPLLRFLASPDGAEFINYAFQGELMGPNIESNREEMKERQFFIYNVYDIQNGVFLTPTERKNLIDKVNSFVKNLAMHVPVLHEAVTLEELGITNMDDLLAYAVGPSIKHTVREGLVFKAIDGRHQFKAISNKYLLEKEKR